MKWKTPVLIAALCAGLLLAGCGFSPPNRVAAGKPKVFFIVIDTLRADRLGYMGNTDGLTPFLDSLTQQSAVFTKCYASSPWTLPSMATMFTGLYPAAHGVEHGLVTSRNQASQQQLNEQYRTLTEQMADAGYTTHAYVTNGHLTPEFGFAQGFEFFHISPWASAQWVANQVAKTRKEIAPDKPSFIFMHFFDPHEPYLYHKWLNMPAPEGYSNQEMSRLVQQKLHTLAQAKDMKSDSPNLRALKALYDGEVRYVDLHLGSILKKIGISDQDLILVTSDHGEAFWEHSNLGHGNTVYNEELHVPLIIRFPGRKFAGSRIEAPVSLVDLLPTILGVAGQKPAEPGNGIDLAQALLSNAFPERRLFSDLRRPVQTISAILDDQWKYIRDFKKETSELYALDQDGSEQRDVQGEYSDLAADLQHRVSDHRNQTPRLPAPMVKASKMTEKDLEQFRALGYLN